jgi:hypothetical protein
VEELGKCPVFIILAALEGEISKITVQRQPNMEELVEHMIPIEMSAVIFIII